jgi:hypothetical protein
MRTEIQNLELGNGHLGHSVTLAHGHEDLLTSLRDNGGAMAISPCSNVEVASSPRF